MSINDIYRENMENENKGNKADEPKLLSQAYTDEINEQKKKYSEMEAITEKIKSTFEDFKTGIRDEIINKMKPKIVQGNVHSDYRGSLFYNNDFDAIKVKRIYVIENIDTKFVRGWQGHKIEQRWFSAIQGSFKIKLIEIDDWKNPTKTLSSHVFELNSKKLNILQVPSGFVSNIRSLEKK